LLSRGLQFGHLNSIDVQYISKNLKNDQQTLFKCHRNHIKMSKCNQFLKIKYVIFSSDNIGGSEVVNVEQVIKAWTTIIPTN